MYVYIYICVCVCVCVCVCECVCIHTQTNTHEDFVWKILQNYILRVKFHVGIIANFFTKFGHLHNFATYLFIF